MITSLKITSRFQVQNPDDREGIVRQMNLFRPVLFKEVKR